MTHIASRINMFYSVVANWLISYLDKNKPVIDIGCGQGLYLKELEKAGFTKLTGYNTVLPNNKEFKNIIVQDLTQPFTVEEKGQVFCINVIEDIPFEYHDTVLNNIANACNDKFVMGWTERKYTGEDDHIACLYNREAIAAIEKHGFTYLVHKTKNLREVFMWTFEPEHAFLIDTLLLFERNV